MVFVAVGTQKFQFDRLLKAIDDLIADHSISEPVYAQTGMSDYVPHNYTAQPQMQKNEFDTFISQCDLLITHSGVGTIMTGLKYEKPVIVVPRQKQYGEHIDDHQIQIADAFSQQNMILRCMDTGQLLACIHEAKTHSFAKYISSNDNVINEISLFLNALE
ncbi:MAG: glycosyl transferase [Oscillospiraceae bacterium]|nr:glycosyl transferase [Oscillospiraceae bacterium]